MKFDDYIKKLESYPRRHFENLKQNIEKCYCQEHQQYAKVITTGDLKFSVECCCDALREQVKQASDSTDTPV